MRICRQFWMLATTLPDDGAPGAAGSKAEEEDT
jgi:hypothetical protein